ncbi:MAG: helix-turn-helix domain-containing protein [Bullifex sp.]
MEAEKTGKLIRRLRLEKGLTQKELADMIYVSDKAVSKWERGGGMPDLSVVPVLSSVLGVSTEALLSGNLEENELTSGNMRKLRFYVCPECGNIVTSLTEGEVHCCGRELAPLEAVKDSEGTVKCERDGGELIISGDHPMTREDYVSFVALVSTDTVLIRKLYPEWDLMIHLPRISQALLYWYSAGEGLKYIRP